MLLTWWVWLSAAVVLVILETLVPGYVFLGFAVGAGLTGLILLLGGAVVPVAGILLIFAMLSLVAWLVMRRVFALKHGSVKTFDRDINDD